MTAIAGVVLCGGESRRMGRPKAWLPFGSEFLLQRVVRIVGLSASPLVVSAAPGQDLPELPAAVVVVRDRVAHLGPLSGLKSALESLPETVEFVYATATDAPFLAPGWVDRLACLIGTADLAIPFHNGHHHPLAALYRRATALAAIPELLESGQYRLFSLVERLETRVVTSLEMADVDPSFLTLKNVNTPEDYEEALGMAGCESINPQKTL